MKLLDAESNVDLSHAILHNYVFGSVHYNKLKILIMIATAENSNKKAEKSKEKMEFHFSTVEDLNESVLMSYFEQFMDINQFKDIDNGQGLLKVIKLYPNSPIIRTVIRKCVVFFTS